MRSIKVLKLLSILILLQLISCSYIGAYEKDFNGKVVDSLTGEPIGGVVVLATWYREIPTVAGVKSHYSDARETVTDVKGEFTINGKGINIIGNRAPMEIMIYKAGYDYENTSRSSFKYQADIVKLEEDTVVIKLKKLTMKERKLQGSPSAPPTEAPLKKVINMLREIDRNRIARGLEPRTLWNGETYEQ